MISTGNTFFDLVRLPDSADCFVRPNLWGPKMQSYEWNMKDTIFYQRLFVNNYIIVNFNLFFYIEHFHWNVFDNSFLITLRRVIIFYTNTRSHSDIDPQLAFLLYKIRSYSSGWGKSLFLMYVLSIIILKKLLVIFL